MVELLEKVAEIRGIPSPQPSPTGEGAGCSGFGDFGDLKGNLGLPLILGRLKSKKQHAQPVFLVKPLIPTATRSSLPVGES